MNHFPGDRRIGMILKGYPRISETFISTEILLLESHGVPIEIFSLKRPRENFFHRNINNIKAPVTYTPEYVLPNLWTLLKTNLQLRRRLGNHYNNCLRRALYRALQRKKTATVRHFLQAGFLSTTRLLDPSIVHLHAHFCHTPTSVALFASELAGIPFSFTAHAKDIYTSEPGQLVRKIKKARFVVTCTKYNASYLKKVLSSDRRKLCNTPIHTIYHGIDLDFFSFSHSPTPAPPYRILTIGRLVPKKGYDDLLRAAKLLDSAGLNFQLIHIGSGEQEFEIKQLVHNLGLEHRIQMLGTLAHDQVVEYYRTAHCFALACKVAANGDRDGIPNVLAEAMAVGLPVVTTNVSAIPELVEHRKTGLLVEPENPGAMAGAILQVLSRRPGIERMVLDARAKVEAEFNNRICIEKLVTLLKSTLNVP